MNTWRALSLLALLAAAAAAAAVAPAARRLAAARPSPGDSGCIELDSARLQNIINGALAQLEAIAAIRERPDGSGPKPEGERVLPADQFPNSTDPGSGLWLGSQASKWTAGYLADCYWRAHALTGDPAWVELAAAELPGLEPVASETDNHKVSHIFDSAVSEAIAARVPGAPLQQYQRVLQTAAGSLAARYSDRVGAIQSWNDIGDPEFDVIIDSMASLKIMFEAAAVPGGDPAWAGMALSHSRKVAEEHFRSDGGTYHVVRYNPQTGAVVWRGTHQGYADNSTWASVQAWGVVGFTHVYNATRDPAMLATACTAADYFLQRLAEADDGVPLWDFDLPKAVQPWKDSSAAAIAASGLLRLGPLAEEPLYTAAGAQHVASLADGYLGWEGGGQRVAAVLRNGTFNAPKGLHSTGLSWGDWYFLDALSTLQRLGNSTACA
ncbi:hypothetical protein ABPG75_005352 [Micractinium tetrahymenae]